MTGALSSSAICSSHIQISHSQPPPKRSPAGIPCVTPARHRFGSSDLKLNSSRFSSERPKLKLKCSSSFGPGGSGSGQNDSRSVLDAFFLGKAFAEALNERIESTVGEVLGTLGRLQAEQQKQVSEFQEDVLERAKRAKEKAAREALEAQGIVTKSPDVSQVVVVSSTSSPTINGDPNPNPNDNDPLIGLINDS